MFDRSKHAEVWGRTGRLHLAVVGFALCAVTAPQSASGQWSRVSLIASKTQPYYVCPQETQHFQCELIQDPTPRTSARGPVKAGAMTVGPEQEVSPALSGGGVGGGFSPADLRSAYGLPSESAGAGQTVAVVDAYNDPNAEGDLGVYRSEYGIPACTQSNGCFRKVNQTGGSSYPVSNEGWASEISLDLDMVSASCPNCQILLVEASSDELNDFAAAENEAATLGATEISDSFGSTQQPSLPAGYASAFEHPGTPIAVASGDSGYGVSSPASSPSVIAVGGTRLVRGAAAGEWEQSAWSGSGSGCSLESKPAWQTDIGCPFRTTNDVAAVADPNTPVSAYDSYGPEGGWQLVGGTSASAPIVAGSMALANAYTKSFDGAEAFYLQAAANGTGALHDVLSGADGTCGDYLCEAGPGYDGPTGLGSLNGAPEVPPPPATPPIFLTEGASAVTSTTATLHATVNPNGGDVEECTFEYGATSSSGASAECSPAPGPAQRPVSVSASLTALAANTTYHFRISIVTSGGSGRGWDETLRTAPSSAPTVQSEGPSAVAQSAGTLEPPSAQSAATPPVPDVELLGRSFTASASGAVHIPLTCPAAETRCTGTVALRTVTAVRARNSKPAILALAQATFADGGGQTKNVNLYLSAKARALLTRVRSLRVRVTIIGYDELGGTHTAQTIIVLRAPKHTRHRG
jgi:hypothetical protein